MAPKSTATPKQPAATTPAAAPDPSPAAPGSAVQSLLKAYNETTSPRLKLIDAFLVFLMVSGVLQFLYCILVTNFPFNAFLAGYVHHRLKRTAFAENIMSVDSAVASASSS